MAKSVLELAVGTGQWDAGLKKAKTALDNFTQANGGLQSALNKDSQSMQTFVRMMGQMDSQAKTAKGQMNDYKSTIEALTMQYNRMTDAQKAAIGQDYLQAIDQMKQKYQGVASEVDKINQSLKQTTQLSSDAGSGGGSGLFGGGKLDGMLQVFGGNLMTKGAGMAMGLAGELKDMVTQGIELARQGEGIRIAFERLGRGDILQGLREATHGTVTDIELMKAAVKFNDFKLPIEELGTMLAFAQQKAKDTGQSVDYMVDSIVTGLGRKSLMILDNLGLSAAEIRDKMKETGDMTKAVGAIIREQMEKAGDYIETAADRATQANVSLQNKMEELGRKFAPVEEASNQLWTSIKIGIMDIVSGPLAKMLNQLTEAGRLKNMLDKMNGNPDEGGDTKVDNQLKKLQAIKKAGGSDYMFNSTLNSMMEDYNRQINDLDKKIKNGGKWEGEKKGFYHYESVDVLQRQKDALTIMRNQLQSGAKDITKPVPVEITNTTTTTTTTTTPTKTTPTTTEPTYAADSIAAQQAKVSELSKQWNEAGSEFRNDYLAQLIAAEKVLERMKNEATLFRENSAGKLLGGDVDTSGLGSITGSNKTVNITGLDEETLKNASNLTDAGKKVENSWKDAASAVQSVGSALSGIDDPGAKIVGTIGQAIASIALGFAQASAADSKLGVFGWIAAIAGGMATMVSTIAAIHSATGYAEGGIIKGTTFSGDQIMANGGSIGLNAGELVLNRAQQSTLASQLQGQDKQMHVVGEVQGEKIILVANRTFRRKGQGEIVTW